jgi:hypothetical protein
MPPKRDFHAIYMRLSAKAIAGIANLAQQRGCISSVIVDAALAAYFERHGSSLRSITIHRATPEMQMRACFIMLVLDENV